MSNSPNRVSQNVWSGDPGSDFLHLVGAGGAVVGWVDSSGSLQGSLSKGVEVSAPQTPNLAPNTFNVLNYGAKGDTRAVADGVIINGSPIVTSATASFSAADVGKQLTGVYDPNGSIQIFGVIRSVESPTQRSEERR